MSESKMSAAPRPPRRRRVVPAVVAACILLAATVTFVIDVVSVQLEGHALIWPYLRLATQMRQTTWSDTPIVVISIAVAVLGVILIVVALTPGHRKLLAVTTDRLDEAAGISRRGVRRALRRSVTQIDGVSEVDIRLKRRRARLEIVSPLRDPAGLGPAAREAAERCMQQLRLARSVRIDVRIHPYKES